MRSLWISLLVVGLVGCVAGEPSMMGDDDPGPDPDPVDPPPMGDPSIEGTPVSSFETTSCSTSTVLALSKQIAEEVNCMLPGQLVRFDETAHVQFSGSAVLPYLGEGARADLYAAANRGGTVQVNSAFRTVVQQYLLRRWFELGRCGITAAAEPGRSNHESGRALDLSNYGDWIGLFDDVGWAHDVPGDPVHFDHLASEDIRGADVLAFQRLWNRNAPDDQIAEDGSYGPETEARVRRAPAEGFGIGATCESARNAPPLPVTHGIADVPETCAD
ncbi:MAG TPA: M15 family metallopeptidase [Kofleriaceae bacterium]|nr:M15 family metallopeptidase [Kofleriaceae bacterium]